MARFRDWRGGGKSLKVVVFAGPQTLIKICEALCDWNSQYKAGYLLPLKLVAAFCEDIFTEEGAHHVRALHRIHRFYQPLENVKKGIWDPNTKRLIAVKARMESRYEELRRRYQFLNLPPLSYADPNSEEAKNIILNSSDFRIREGRRPFDMVLCGPNRAWISRWHRKITGELAFPIPGDSKYKRHFELYCPNIYNRIHYTYGFGWGFHPVGSAGNDFDFAEFAGSDPITKIVSNRRKYGCVALMGLGPYTMDDPRLFDITSGATSYKLCYSSKRRSEEKFHEQCYQIMRWYGGSIPNVMFGDGTPQYANLGDAIGKRIRVLFGDEVQGILGQDDAPFYAENI